MNRGAMTMLLWLLPAGAAAGQDSTRSEPGPVAPRSCFWGAPLPACRSFWVTEAAYLIRLAGTGGDPFPNRFERWSASVHLGHLRNLSPKVALGGGVLANVVDGVTLGIQSRIRYWVSPETALDLAPGLLVTGVPGPPRFTADLSLMVRDRAGLTLQSFVLPVETYFPDGSFTRSNRLVVYGGLKLGSKPGLIGAAADVAALAIAVGAFLIACATSTCD